MLKYAFEGKLTKEWRKANKDRIEPAEKLLERIQAERERLYKEACEKAKKEGTRKPPKPKELPPVDVSGLPELPEGWIWVYSGNLLNSVTSGSRGWAKYYSDNGSIFIRITNLNFDKLKLDLSPNRIQYVSLPSDVEGMRTKIKEGDFLFSITGYLGMFAISPKLKDAYVNQHIALARPTPGYSKQFFGYYITSASGGRCQLEKKTKGAVKAGLGLDDIQSVLIPFCSLEEQRKIVSEIEHCFSIADEVEKTVEYSLKQSERLRQSILKKAFSGRLVPQDQNDEPASVLLERIKAEKAEREAEQKKQRQKTKTVKKAKTTKRSKK